MSGTLNCRARAGGFTLIEVLVALTLGSMVVLMVHQAFGATSDLSARLDQARSAHRARMNATARLTQLFGSVAVGTAGSAGFQGGRESAEFTTEAGQPVRISVAEGWLILQQRRGGADSLLTADEIAFDYLLSHGAESSWVREWHSPVSAPLAARLRLKRAESVDTLLFFIGPRG